VIFIGVTTDDPHLAEIQKAAIPVSVIDYPLHGPNVAFIGTDSYQGIRQAMDWLFECGHRHISFIGGPAVSAVAVERELAYRQCMEEKGSFDPALILRGDFSKESGYHRALDILRTRPMPDAVLAANDFMALGAIKAFKEHGVRVPVDVSVMGFDNAVGSDSADPSLTTIGQNTLAIGTSAVHFILEKLDGHEPESIIKIEPRLIIRESVRRIPRL
jgi:LacI family transcriptional regulator